MERTSGKLIPKRLKGSLGVGTLIILLVGIIFIHFLYSVFLYYTTIFQIREALDASLLSTAAQNYNNPEVYQALRENAFENVDFGDSISLSDVRNNLADDLGLQIENGDTLLKASGDVTYYTVRLTNINSEVNDNEMIYSADAEVTIPFTICGQEVNAENTVHSRVRYAFKEE